MSMNKQPPDDISQIALIGTRIQWLREQKNMSQGQLAKAIGIKQPSMSALENGKTKRPNSANLLRIAAILEANPDWIINGEGDPWHCSPPPASGSAEIYEIYKALPPDAQAMLLAAARALTLHK